MKGIVHFFIKNQLAANLLMISIIIFGIMSALNMNSTFFPETESRNLQIQAIYPGASPTEVEEGIVQKVEESLKGLTGIERVTSVSSENAGSISVLVEKGFETDLVLRDVQNAVESIASFPTNMEPIVVFKRENIGFAISFALSGDVNLKTLKEKARIVEDEVRSIDGISKVSLSGFPDEEIEISFRENDLEAYQITFSQAANAVRAANIEITGGSIKGPTEELLIRARNKNYFANELRNIPVKTLPNGDVIRLYKVADIDDKWVDNPNRNYINGKPSVIVTVQNTLKEDMLTITEKVRKYIDSYNESTTEIKATVIRDGSITLNQRIDLLTENGIIGFILVTVILAMFLNWRLAWWVALAIPICFCGMFIFALTLNVTINVVSLFGMILVIGILVDDGIVVSESIYQMYEGGVDRTEASIQGTLRVLPSVFSAIVTTCITFLTFFFIDGRIGEIFKEMAIVVIFSLIFSLVESVLILPAHVSHSDALKKNKKVNPVTRWLDNSMIWVRDRLYGPVLRFSLQYKFIAFAVIFGMFLLTLGAFSGGVIRNTFFPVIERDDVIINLKLPSGTPETETLKWLNHIEEAVWKGNDELALEYYQNEKEPVERVEKSLGPSTYEGSIIVRLLDGENRGELSNREATNRFRKLTGVINEAEVLTFGQAGVFGKPVSLSLVGDNYKELGAATREVKETLEELAELSDVTDNNQLGLKEINVSLKEKAYTLGLDLSTILSQVRAGFFGQEVQRLQRGEDEVRVWVRYAEKERQQINQLNDMKIRFADGRAYPLHELADFEIKRGVIKINHLDNKREIQIQADIANDDVSVSDLTSNLKSTIVPQVLEKYPTVTALYEGQSREQQKTSASMQKILPVILLLMFVTMALTFNSVSQTVMVLMLIPFSFIGVGWGHYIENAPISMFSVLGVIALIGVLVNDALVFVSTYNQNLKAGMKQMDAIEKTALSRFRPIVLTTITTVAGLYPLLLETSLQAQFLIPMAISVAYGLLAVTVITLILLPILLIFSNRVKYYLVWLWRGEEPTLESVEPAISDLKEWVENDNGESELVTIKRTVDYTFIYGLIIFAVAIYFISKNLF